MVAMSTVESILGNLKSKSLKVFHKNINFGRLETLTIQCILKYTLHYYII